MHGRIDGANAAAGRSVANDVAGAEFRAAERCCERFRARRRRAAIYRWCAERRTELDRCSDDEPDEKAGNGLAKAGDQISYCAYHGCVEETTSPSREEDAATQLQHRGR